MTNSVAVFSLGAGAGLGLRALSALGLGPPEIPKPPKPPKPEDPRPKADAAAERARRQASGAGGRSSTVLTGPSGLTGGSPAGQHKQLLGQ